MGHMCHYIALDIETIPNLAFADYSPAIQAYLERRLQKGRVGDPELKYEKLAALHPAFGRIACLSVGFVQRRDGHDAIRLKSFTGGERTLLLECNELLARHQGLFVHYNGLSFDAPFILHRMAHHGLRCTSQRFCNLRRFSFNPHCDLLEYFAHWDHSRAVPLGVLAELEGLPPPKGDLDGSKVYAAFQAGEIDRIARYCEGDVVTTINLFRRAVAGETAIPQEHCFRVSGTAETDEDGSADIPLPALEPSVPSPASMQPSNAGWIQQPCLAPHAKGCFHFRELFDDRR